jgi:hypothetical protein
MAGLNEVLRRAVRAGKALLEAQAAQASAHNEYDAALDDVHKHLISVGPGYGLLWEGSVFYIDDNKRVRVLNVNVKEI